MFPFPLQFSLTRFPLPLCKSRQCLPALSLSLFSINFIFICYLQALERRPEGCTFPGMCPFSSPNKPRSTNPEPFTSLPYLVASSRCFLRRVLMAESSHCIFTLHQSSLICASRHPALSARSVLFLKVCPLLFRSQLLTGHSVCCDLWCLHKRLWKQHTSP